MTAPTAGPPDGGWTDGDQGMWLTCRIIADIRSGRVPELRVQTYFRLPPATVAFVNGPLRVLELRSAGDGSYQSGAFVVGGGGPLGLALLAGSLAGSAINNNRARNRAAADAQVVFRHQFDADLYVTNSGFILQNPTGTFTWSWADVHAMQLVGPHDLLVQAQSTRGPLTWRLITPWAELLLVCWALDQHPHHPQLVDGSWLVPGWLDRARAYGRDPGLGSARLGGAGPPPQLPGYR